MLIPLRLQDWALSVYNLDVRTILIGATWQHVSGDQCLKKIPSDSLEDAAHDFCQFTAMCWWIGKMKVMELNGFDISNHPTPHCPWHLLYLTCTPLSNAWPRDFPIGMPFLPMGIPFGPLPFPFICKPTAAGATAGTAASVMTGSPETTDGNLSQ